MINFSKNPQNVENKPVKTGGNNTTIRVISTIILSVLVVLIIVGACLGCYFAGRKAELNLNIKDDLAIANEVYTLIKENYYKDITKEEFNNWAAIGLSSAMDQFSGLSYASTLPTMQFGISIKSDAYNNHIISDISKSVNSTPTPAESAVGTYEDGSSAKLERGDLLISVDGKSVKGLTTDALNSSEFFGKASITDSVEVVVQKSDGRTAKFNLRKNIINTNYADYQDLGGGVGYIKLKSFTGINDQINAAAEFAICAEQFRGKSKLILDLRDNGGGSVSLLQQIASYIIHDSKGNSNGLNIIRLDSEKQQSQSFCTAEGNNWLGKDKNGNLIENFKVAVLVNENSASASEALLGAIKFYCKEATIIGSPTYGKGIAQQTYQLATTKDYLLSITIGHFYVPVQVNGKVEWKTYHGESMLPSSDQLTLQKFSSVFDFTEDGFYKDYYNNDLKQEKAVKLALEVLN